MKSKKQINKQNRNKSDRYREPTGGCQTGGGRKRREIDEGDCKASTSGCKTEVSHRYKMYSVGNDQ